MQGCKGLEFTIRNTDADRSEYRIKPVLEAGKRVQVTHQAPKPVLAMYKRLDLDAK